MSIKRNYDFEIKVIWSQSTEAKSLKEAKEIIKETMLTEYNIELTDEEIIYLK